MRTPLLVLLLSVLVSASAVNAQTVADTTRFSETMWSMKRKKVVLDFLDLSEAEKASFWPMYESYYQAIRYMEMESYSLQVAYDDLARGEDTRLKDQYLRRMLQNEILLAKVRRQYYKKFRRALSPELATEFMQLDDTLRLMLRMEARQILPGAEMTHASVRAAR